MEGPSFDQTSIDIGETATATHVITTTRPTCPLRL